MSDEVATPRYRVLLVTDAYPPLIGGADRAVQLLGYALRDRGHIVTVATAWQPALPAREDDEGVAVHRLRDLSSRARFLSENPNKHSPAPFPDPEAVWRFHRLIASFQPDVVHSYGWITYSCAAALSFTRVPLVVSTRDYANTCAVRTLMQHQRKICSGPAIGKCLSCSVDFYGPAKGLIASAGVLGSRRLLLTRLSGLHYNSTYMREVMQRDLLRHGDCEDAHPMPNATVPSFRDDSQDAAPDREILARLPDRPFILFVGALRRVKGVELLLRAYQQLHNPPPLVLIGTQEIDTPTEIPAGVLVLRSVPHGTVMAAWDSALFGVFPSTWPEPFGNVVHEAMSRARAVIGTRPGGHADMIDNERNGLLVAAGSQSELRLAMQRLIDDRELRERLADAAGQRDSDFTADAAMPRLLALYEQAIRSQRGGRRPLVPAVRAPDAHARNGDRLV